MRVEDTANQLRDLLTLVVGSTFEQCLRHDSSSKVIQLRLVEKVANPSDKSGQRLAAGSNFRLFTVANHHLRARFYRPCPQQDSFEAFRRQAERRRNDRRQDGDVGTRWPLARVVLIT